MRIAGRESLEFRKQLAPPPGERHVCFSVFFNNTKKQLTTNLEVSELSSSRSQRVASSVFFTLLIKPDHLV